MWGILCNHIGGSPSLCWGNLLILSLNWWNNQHCTDADMKEILGLTALLDETSKGLQNFHFCSMKCCKAILFLSFHKGTRSKSLRESHDSSQIFGLKLFINFHNHAAKSFWQKINFTARANLWNFAPWPSPMKGTQAWPWAGVLGLNIASWRTSVPCFQSPLVRESSQNQKCTTTSWETEN